MTLQELFIQINNAQSLLNEFQDKFLKIKELIKTESKIKNPFSKGWNRFNYYLPTKLETDPIEFNMCNGYQYHIFNQKIDDSWIKLDIVQLMDGKPVNLIIDEPYLIFMFSFQKADVPGWPSDPQYEDNSWINSTLLNGKYHNINEYYRGQSLFVSFAKPISKFINQQDIIKTLKDINQNLISEIYEKCQMKIDNIF